MENRERQRAPSSRALPEKLAVGSARRLEGARTTTTRASGLPEDQSRDLASKLLQPKPWKGKSCNRYLSSALASHESRWGIWRALAGSAKYGKGWASQ